MPVTGTLFPSARAVTSGPQFHWFGYYDKCPWSADQRLMLAMEIDFMDRPTQAGDRVRVGLVDLQAGPAFHALDDSPAWSWQQGCMLQWLGTDPDRLVVYNSVADRRHLAIVRDVHSGAARTLPLPVFVVSTDGAQALCINQARLGRTRSCCGSQALPDETEGVLHPEDDGIWWMDMVTGEHRLVLSFDQIVRFEHRPDMEEGESWVNHLLLNEAASRVVFLHRWRRPDTGSYWTRMLSAKLDGSELCCLADHEMVSHFDWRGNQHLLTWARHRQLGDRYFLFRDRSRWLQVVGEGTLTCDGHCTYSPDERVVLTDTSPDAEHMRTLLLYDPASGARADLGRFLSPPEYRGDIRCDLHPRWSRDGRQVCFDSLHEGGRQMYVVDVSEVLDRLR